MKLGNNHEVPPSACTNCGELLDMATGVTEDLNDDPMPGVRECFTICIRCGHIMTFAEDLTLRDLTDEEALAVAGDKRMLAIQRARAIVLRERAYVEDAIRSGARQVGVYLTHENFNELVDNAMSKAARAAR